MTVRDRGALPASDEEVVPFLAELGIPGIVDVHVHAMPERLQAAVWRYFDQLDDPPWPIAYRGELDERLRWLREVGVVAHTALAYAHRPGMLRWLKTPPSIPSNVMRRWCRRSRSTPRTASPRRCSAASGGRPRREGRPPGRQVPPDRSPPRRGVDADRGGRIPVVLHASAVYGVEGGAEYCGAGPVAALLDAHPDLLLVIAHLGLPSGAEFLELAEQAPRLLFDTAMTLTDPPYGGLTFPEEHLDRLRALHGRLLYGSDYPTIPHAYAAQLRGLAVLELDDDALRAMLYGRGRELLAPVG